jgi:hypothetical protein
MFLKSAVIVLLSASASVAFAPASVKTSVQSALSMSSVDQEDRRSFVTKVR